MASATTMFACMLFSLLAISATGLTGFQWLPPWIQAPLLRLHPNAGAPDSDDGARVFGPEEVLLQRLKKVDAVREPEAAYALHKAIGNILRSSGTQGKLALEHFEAARNAAALTTDTDALLAAHLELAEAFIQEGRALDSQRELAVASGVLADHFVEHQSKLNRGRGRAKFELGWTESGLEYFEEAEKHATQPEDKVHAACDIAMARACLGVASKSLEPLRKALEVLHAIRKEDPEGGLPVAVHNELAADVHFRLAEAFHSIHNTAFAHAHYLKALNLHRKLPSLKAQRVSAIEKGIANLDRGEGPELRCPSLPRAPWDKPKAPPLDMKSDAFLGKINHMLAEHKYDLAESELKAGLSSHSRPYKGLEAATALNMLGSLYQKQKNWSKAAKHFRQALTAATRANGAEQREATVAYEGLKDVKPQLSVNDQRVAAAVIGMYLDALGKVASKKPENVKRPASSEEAAFV